MLSKYNIHVENGLTLNKTIFTSIISYPKVLIVTDEIVAKLYLDQILQTLHNHDVTTVILATGEKQKNWQNIEKIIQKLTENHFDRSATIVGLGGGVIGDLAGFTASIYMRGINFVQIPTSLMAQVDAAIGGKTACNFLGIKNLLGTFYMPHAVLIDPALLHTLPEREYKAGLAEVIKYGFVCDADFFCWLETHKHQIKSRQDEALIFLIQRCCEIKLTIIKDDPHDHGQRMILNFGHSFAHAIESATGHTYYLHGEAVAIGMLLAAHLAVTLGLLQQSIFSRLVNLLEYFELNTKFAAAKFDTNMLVNFMRHDKKTRHGKLQLVLPCELGKAVILPDLNLQDIEDLMQHYV